MIGFMNTSSSFSQIAIQALQIDADTLYITTDTFTPIPLPTTGIDITDQTVMTTYGETALYADGTTEDTTRLNTIATNLSITNWYIPPGKTIRINDINIPEHVTAFYGGGTVKEYVKDVRYPFGCIAQDGVHSGFVIDGLTFVGDGVKFTQNTGEYGFIMFNKSNAINCEIRNCLIDGTNNSFRNAITLYGDHDLGSCKGLRIYNNETKNISRASIEILHRSAIINQNSTAFQGLKIYNNYIHGSGFCGVSFSQVRANCEVYNNDIHGHRWAFELNQSKNIDVHHNEAKDVYEEFVSNGGKGWHTPEYDDDADANICWVHHNHFENEENRIHMYGGSSCEYYDNFIQGIIQADSRDGFARTGKIYNNTLVKSMDIPVVIGIYNVTARAISYLVDVGSYAGVYAEANGNDIYMTGTTANREGIYLNSTMDSTTLITNNNIRMANTNDCITTPTNATVTGTTCTQNYAGAVPTTHTGAGLSEPLNVGIPV